MRVELPIYKLTTRQTPPILSLATLILLQNDKLQYVPISTKHMYNTTISPSQGTIVQLYQSFTKLTSCIDTLKLIYTHVCVLPKLQTFASSTDHANGFEVFLSMCQQWPQHASKHWAYKGFFLFLVTSSPFDA